MFNISDDFKNKSKNNPPNLFRQCDYCNSPQPRYKLHPDHQVAFSDHKYLEFKQCLPGCVANSNKTNIPTNLSYREDVPVLLETDISCVAYDTPSPHNFRSNSHPHFAPQHHLAFQPSSSNTSPPPVNVQQKDSFNKGMGC